jgi:hypothetical protein
MEIVTEINEKSLLETRYPPKRTYHNDTFDPTFWVSKIPKRWVDRIFTEIFWFSQKIGKNSYKNAGIVLGYPSIFRKQIFYPKKFVYNCLLVLQGFTKKLPKN